MEMLEAERGAILSCGSDLRVMLVKPVQGERAEGVKRRLEYDRTERINVTEQNSECEGPPE